MFRSVTVGGRLDDRVSSDARMPELASAVGAAQSGVINIVTGLAVLLIVFLARGGIASLPERALAHLGSRPH